MFKLTENQLLALQQRLPNAKHHHEEDAGLWAKASPHDRCSWVGVETREDWVAAVDSCSGLVALFFQDALRDVSRHSVESPHCVLLDRDFYKLNKYLWM